MDKVKICDHCGDTVLKDDLSCPVCSQQIIYDSFPLAIIRKGLFHTRRQSGRTAGAVGKWFTCAVISSTKNEYLTACGDVVQTDCSVWSRAPNCTKCRKELRKILK
jgi:hypothetical protein